MCIRTLGRAALEIYTSQLNMQIIEEIDQKVRVQLGTTEDFGFVIEYFKKIFTEINNK